MIYIIFTYVELFKEYINIIDLDCLFHWPACVLEPALSVQKCEFILQQVRSTCSSFLVNAAAWRQVHVAFGRSQTRKASWVHRLHRGARTSEATESNGGRGGGGR